jgi:hypothetical protein
MNHAVRRQAEQSVDHCSLCGREFDDADITAGGVVGGTVHLVGTCCADKLTHVHGYSRYFQTNDMPPDYVLQRAGIRPTEASVPRDGDMDAQDDDRAWFTRHPRRTHRARRAVPGETHNQFPTVIVTPEGHELWVVVRQTESAQRLRASFLKNSAVDLPDDDAALAALFDRIAQAPAGQFISERDVCTLSPRRTN